MFLRSPMVPAVEIIPGLAMGDRSAHRAQPQFFNDLRT